MATAGKIYPELTSIEIDEQGVIWLVQNHFENDSVILEMQASSTGHLILDDDEDFSFFDDEEDYFYEFQ